VHEGGQEEACLFMLPQVRKLLCLVNEISAQAFCAKSIAKICTATLALAGIYPD
jgi:hypothetical protein